MLQEKLVKQRTSLSTVNGVAVKNERVGVVNKNEQLSKSSRRIQPSKYDCDRLLYGEGNTEGEIGAPIDVPKTMDDCLSH